MIFTRVAAKGAGIGLSRFLTKKKKNNNSKMYNFHFQVKLIGSLISLVVINLSLGVGNSLTGNMPSSIKQHRINYFKAI